MQFGTSFVTGVAERKLKTTPTCLRESGSDFEFRVVHLLDWLSTKARGSSLFNYST